MADDQGSKDTGKLKAFRWKGEHGPNSDRKGVLHIVLADAKRIVVFPGEIVKKAEHLAAVGEARIAELVKEGKAEFVEVLEKLGIGKVENITSDASDAEKASAQDVASQAAARDAAAARMGAAQAAAGKSGDSRVSGEVPTVAGRTVATGTQAAPEGAGPKA